MTFNTDLAERVLAQIKDQPDTWRQSQWVTETDCGTAFCFAGHACILSGYTAILPNGFVTAPGDLTNLGIPSAATRLLGLTFQQADWLFAPENDLDDLERLVKHYANNPDGSIPEENPWESLDRIAGEES